MTPCHQPGYARIAMQAEVKSGVVVCTWFGAQCGSSPHPGCLSRGFAYDPTCNSKNLWEGFSAKYCCGKDMKGLEVIESLVSQPM